MSEPFDAGGYLDMLRRNQEGPPQYSDYMAYLEGEARRTGVPLNGQFELSPLCNLNCGMCYVHCSEKQLAGRTILPTAVWKDLMAQAFEAGMLNAVLTGGECLLYPGFDELYLYLQSLGCLVTVLTNAVLLDDERIRFFTEHPPDLLQITLYGPSEEAYERVTGRRVFHTVVENIRRARAAGLPIHLTVTPNRYLGEDAFETVRLARSLARVVRINSSLFAPPEEPGRLTEADELSAEFYARLLRYDRELLGLRLTELPEEQLPEPGGPCRECEERGLLCGGGRSTFVISWQGRLRPCNRLDFTADPLRDGFAAAWRAVNRIASEWPRTPECQGCPYEDVCDSCAANRAKYAEPGKQPLGMCRRTKHLVSRGVLAPPECRPD